MFFFFFLIRFLLLNRYFIKNDKERGIKEKRSASDPFQIKLERNCEKRARRHSVDRKKSFEILLNPSRSLVIIRCKHDDSRILRPSGGDLFTLCTREAEIY